MSLRMKIGLACAAVMDLLLIVLLIFWLTRTVSKAEFDMLAEEITKTEELNRDLLAQMARMQEGQTLEYRSDVVLSISNMVLNKMEAALFPVEFPLEGDVTGTIRAEELTDFQFLDDDRIIFRLRIIGKNMQYNPRGNSMLDKMLSGMELAEEIVLAGTGELYYTFDEPGQQLDMRLDIAGIDFHTGLPQFVEKMIKDRFSSELRDEPHYVEFDFKPLKVRAGDNVRWGYYHVREVENRANRLMAIADLTFSGKKQD